MLEGKRSLLGGRFAISRIVGSVMNIPVWSGVMMTFLLLFALLLTALLAFSVESFTAGGDVADRQKAAYAADASIDTAVTRIKQDTAMQVGRDSAYSPSQPCGLTYHPTDGTADATATCTPQTASGAIRPGTDGPAKDLKVFYTHDRGGAPLWEDETTP